MTLWGYRLAMTPLSVIASPSLSVIARSEATKQSPLLLHPFIANRRVGKCVGVKQSPRCTFLLVLSVLGGLLRLIVIRLAMTSAAFAMMPLSVIARAQPEAISSLLIPVGVRRFEGIASLTAFARNDVVGLQTHNGGGRLFACNGVTKTLLIVLQRSYYNIFR